MSDIIEKIRKLLAVAGDKGASLSEASTAAALAQKLMTRHAINEEMLADRSESFGEAAIDVGPGPMPTWKIVLASGIALVNGAKAAIESNRYHHSVHIYGTPDAIEACSVIFAWLSSEIERLLLATKKTPVGLFGSRSFWTSFRMGCASTISQRLMEAQRAEEDAVRGEAASTHAGSTALARVETAIQSLHARTARIEKWLEETGPKMKTVSRKTRSCGLGYAAGRAAGANASLRPDRGSLPS